ncbi:thioredoxin domain-containing protein [Sphingomonas oligophenolica]|uniref:Protein-disulfide isomerase n=1 Tax=Sphingomonas oligophenolica TaxID=301154 RepID=A0A502CRW6_9SPHN|nr:thioredoxin domain-containing protein [Sphingomonas oligophenolica]TPG15472.1 protein-disulfide isomerase [Sphingomonas oligophenolica]
MRFLTALFLLPLALVACSKGETTGNVTAAPVAAAAAPAGQKWQDVVAKTDEGYRMGNPDAPVKVVEYGARLCPGCKQFATTAFQPLIDNYVSTGKVSFEFRDFLIHGPAELGLALMGQCGDPATFFPILEQTYANQDALNDAMIKVPPTQIQALQGKSPVAIVTGWTEAIGGIDFMKQRGMPEAKAKACLADTKKMDAITAVTQKRGGDGTVESTPTVIVDGKPIDNPTWDNVEQALKAAGA